MRLPKFFIRNAVAKVVEFGFGGKYWGISAPLLPRLNQ